MLGAAISSSAFGADACLGGPDWQVAGRLGLLRFVVAESRAKDREFFDAIVKALCEPDVTCFLYLNSQQQNFVNYILAQNGSATYARAGLGAYAQWNATDAIQFAGGCQYPNSASVATLQFDGFRYGDLGWFGYAQWTPRFKGQGAAQYSFTWYESPATRQEPATRGWSLNAVQNLNDTWAVFARANGASGFTTAIRASYALGVAMNDPLRRSPTDQIGVAIGLSEAASAPTNPANARNEKIVEAYWNWTFFGGLLLTPDVQLVVNPALDPDRDNVWILSLRATVMF